MSLAKKDKAVIWHPYTQEKTSGANILIVKGKGVYLFDDKGNKYIDAVSSWWVNIHGHGDPYIAKKVSAQLKKLEHVIFAGFTHKPAVKLAERILKVLPANQSKVFYSDNGSTAVEVALKMAFQYWHNKGIKRSKLIAFRNGYHGDTFGAMSVSGRSVFTAPFLPFLFDVEFIDVPVKGKEAASILQMKQLLKGNDVAAFIFEPLIQGAGGMVMYDSKPLDELLALCKKHKTLTIADEVMTGFGRTGKLFACDYLKNQPDIICLSKGLTGGTMALGLTTCTENIYKAFLSDDKLKTFFHGHSYTANPVACTAALASFDLVERKDFMKGIQRINKHHLAFVKKLKGNAKALNPRVLGTILAFELKTPEAPSYLNKERDNIYRFFIKGKILLRPLGSTVYVMPPYCITNAQLKEVEKRVVELLYVV